MPRAALLHDFLTPKDLDSCSSIGAEGSLFLLQVSLEISMTVCNDFGMHPPLGAAIFVLALGRFVHQAQAPAVAEVAAAGVARHHVQVVVHNRCARGAPPCIFSKR